jgi:hypothetical protein
MDIWDHIGAGVEARLETDLLPALYAATALETAAIRATLTSQDLPWVDPDRASIPPLEELSVAGEILVAQARKEAAGIGAAGGIAGAVGAPPEAMAAIIHCMRLGQKLCVLYGHDPETGQGHVTLWRCIGVAYELELPEEMEVKLRQLPQAAAMQLPAVRELAHWVLKRAVRRAVMGALGKGIRWVPGLATGLSAYSAQKRLGAQGVRMKRTLHEQASRDAPPRIEVVEAEVVDPR